MPDDQLLVTLDAAVTCAHKLGVVSLVAAQHWVRAAGVPLLVATDPEGRPITECPNIGATIRPCLHTLSVRAGYSTLVRIGGQPVVRSSLTGFTDGTPPGIVEYQVRDPAQTFVRTAG